IGAVSGSSGHPGQANYSAAKGGLIALTKALALELATRGITVNAVAPGLVETEIIAHLKPEARRDFLTKIPIARFGLPEEIAAVVGFLASDRASYVTGQVWRGGGGVGGEREEGEGGGWGGGGGLGGNTGGYVPSSPRL